MRCLDETTGKEGCIWQFLRCSGWESAPGRRTGNRSWSFCSAGAYWISIRKMCIRDSEEVMRHLAESKALILQTLCYEGQPMVILESYAAGTPVLASDLGNAGNMVIPEVTGFRFAPGDPAAIRETVKKMEQDVYKRQFMNGLIYQYNRREKAEVEVNGEI